ncbi:YigZ family protein [Aliiglaciecola sp. LCG003]|uniref:YigZ family protein n=1 Tax=Aliiglaciecola sp. LCG003 TaxID=3053655 RepID=UPI0025738427|nr:YigZ family protein [Aliiglaciecola sp. LCG003]WJG10116.1 YigZ family protein [Aliiglaciecola sp. LCG003]
MTYPIPAKSAESLYEIKKSKFIAMATYVTNREQALQALSAIKAAFPDARHHCWAYLLGNPDSPISAAMSDDGEPSGTAGKPILNVLQHKGVGDIILVVTRYFGGIKLGAGGLVRAYSTSSQLVMEKLVTTTMRLLIPVTVVAQFKDEQFLRHWTEQHQGVVEDCSYTNDVMLTLSIEPADYDSLKSLCASMGAVCKKVA